MAAGLARIVEICFVLNDNPSDAENIRLFQYLTPYVCLSSSCLTLSTWSTQPVILVNSYLPWVESCSWPQQTRRWFMPMSKRLIDGRNIFRRAGPLIVEITCQGGRGPRYICSRSKCHKSSGRVDIAKRPLLIGLLDVIHHLLAYEFLGESVYQLRKEQRGATTSGILERGRIRSDRKHGRRVQHPSRCRVFRAGGAQSRPAEVG
jgi:hypothetical protein